MQTDERRICGRDVIARLLKIRLRLYSEHVIYQAIREAEKVLRADPQAIDRAVREAELYAWLRMETRPIAGQNPTMPPVTERNARSQP